MIDNLLFNAIEHTPRGGRIRLRVNSSADKVLVEVEDEGPGVPEGEREAIFEKFRKGSTESRGVGLGLALCKLVAARHGGRVGVRSAAQRGAIFYFELPVKPAAVAAD
jgi:signal transduction histidine kinase